MQRLRREKSGEQNIIICLFLRRFLRDLCVIVDGGCDVVVSLAVGPGEEGATTTIRDNDITAGARVIAARVEFRARDPPYALLPPNTAASSP